MAAATIGATNVRAKSRIVPASSGSSASSACASAVSTVSFARLGSSNAAERRRRSALCAGVTSKEETRSVIRQATMKCIPVGKLGSAVKGHA